MAVKFKLSAGASESSVRHALAALTDSGLSVDRLFPDQTRPALARMFVIRSPQAKVNSVQKILEPFADDVEYVEGSTKRRPLTSTIDG